MSSLFNSAADVEDAYYDAIEEGDLDKLMSVWADSEDIACLLPMQPIQLGKSAVRELWQRNFEQQMSIEITVHHLRWIEQGDIAIHLLEEVVTAPGSPQRPPPIYACNLFLRDASGWHLLQHINSPGPPPSGILPPIPGSD